MRLEVKNLKTEINAIDLRMSDANNQFKKGVLVSAIGYSVTIAGGLMLGRDNDQVGQVLLVAGGITGVTGTAILMDSFNALAGKRKKKRKRNEIKYGN
ncbi:MAG: hypothetical protein AAFQ94_25700 [Bacteroidota bacterium]